MGGRGSSREISDISTNSKSNIRLATLGGRTAAGLYGPLLRRLGGGWKLVAPEAEPVEDAAGVRPPDKSPPAEEMGGVTGGRMLPLMAPTPDAEKVGRIAGREMPAHRV